MTKQEMKKKLLDDIKALEIHLKELEDSQEVGIDQDDALDLKTRVSKLKSIISALVLFDAKDTPHGKAVSLDDITDWFNSFDDEDEDDDDGSYSSDSYSSGYGSSYHSGCGSSYSSSGGCGDGYGGRGC